LFSKELLNLLLLDSDVILRLCKGVERFASLSSCISWKGWAKLVFGDSGDGDGNEWLAKAEEIAETGALLPGGTVTGTKLGAGGLVLAASLACTSQYNLLLML
jgi:hypothetical protein